MPLAYPVVGLVTSTLPLLYIGVTEGMTEITMDIVRLSVLGNLGLDGLWEQPDATMQRFHDLCPPATVTEELRQHWDDGRVRRRYILRHLLY